MAPFSAPRRRKGAKAAGIAYENLFAANIGGEHGVWWQFADSKGTGWCQTDVLVRGSRYALVLECKLSYTEDAWPQMERLYRPVVAEALGLEVLCIQVCKHLRPEWTGVVHHDLRSATKSAKDGGRVVLHWIGVASLLMPSQPPVRALPVMAVG